MHCYEFEDEAEDLAEEGVASEYVGAVGGGGGELVGVEVPDEHNKCSSEVA